MGKRGGDAALGCAPCFCARPWEGARAHTHRLMGRVTFRHLKVYTVPNETLRPVCRDLEGSWAARRQGAVSPGGRMPARVLPATVCLFIFALWHSVMQSEHNFYTESSVM